MELKEIESLGIYILLKKQENVLDKNLRTLLQRLEKTFWGTYSIEEMENIEIVYEKKINSQGMERDSRLL